MDGRAATVRGWASAARPSTVLGQQGRTRASRAYAKACLTYLRP
jgi:hypothetical protein